MANDPQVARSFFLNEHHELARGEKESGGQPPKLAPLDWSAKGNRLGTSLGKAIAQLRMQDDPVKDKHFYLLAKPQETILKLTSDKKKQADQDGQVEEKTEFAGKDSRVFSRLGMDLLRVSDSGSALVHVTPSRAQQLERTAPLLSESGVRERARWITLDSFETVPLEYRIDEAWLQSLKKTENTEAVIELQPMLNRIEIDSVMRAVAAIVQTNAPKGQRIRGNGADYSGRQWLRANLSKSVLGEIANRFSSVQTLHPPLISTVSGLSPSITSTGYSLPAQVSLDLPTVAVIDTGIPRNHAVLAPYRRNGGYAPPQNQGGVGNHGCFVASRVVFGDLPSAPTNSQPIASLRFFDVNVALGPTEIDDKVLLSALDAVRRTSPDIRVFNLSFDNRPLKLLNPINRFESLALAQDLDNFIFENDIVVVVSSGNSVPGLSPESPYPEHITDPNWGLGAFASSFNSLTCSAYVSQLSAGALVTSTGWPSPFSRVGPGMNDSPKPDFTAPGGNNTPNYGYLPGMGVWGLDELGIWRDRCGTSYAAPVLAREAALAFQRLDAVCSPGTRPFAATVKAYLALTAVKVAPPDLPEELAKLSLGHGRADVERLGRPLASTAVFLWQGILEDKDDIARVQIPIPRAWIEEAKAPCFRIVTAADVPVDSAATNLWASRKILSALRPGPDARAAIGKRQNSNEAYPLSLKEYKLRGLKSKPSLGDIWTIELSYEQIADYLPTMTFTSQQRLAFAAELYDASSDGASPQGSLQAMTFTQSMVTLSVSSVATQTPVMLRTFE